MIIELKEKFNIVDYKKNIAGEEKEKVSFFFKGEVIKNKKVLFLDLEFSQNKVIYEMGGFVIDNGKLKESFFNEYSLPYGEKIWNFDTSRYSYANKLNVGKSIFSKSDTDKLMALIDSVDYVVMHNYVAELTCIHKLLFKNKIYNKNNIGFFNEGKVICTNYTFNNKYFKSLGVIEKCSNSEISKVLGWEVTDGAEFIQCKNISINITFKIKKPKEVVSELHNSYFDSAVTLTNLFSLYFLKS